MFKLIPNPQFTATVPLTVPGQDKPGSVEFTFRHLGRRELNAWVKSASQGAELAGDADFLGQVIADWSGPQNSQGEPVPYDVGTLAALLDAYPASGQEIFAGYLKALTESRSGN